MTSSLVGSEMCIRDRRKSVAPELECISQPVQRGAQAGGAAMIECSVDPVSYTHLTLPTICSV
eukprot:2598382-Prorocentrum_lima.AAC.1